MMFENNLVVAVKAQNKYLKDNGHKVFLPFGTEYSLFFRNKDTRRVVIGPVVIDGTDILNDTRMILDGNSEWNLEGGGKAFDPAKTKNYRFKFIEKTAKISEHRGDDPSDGLVSVTFQYEATSVVLETVNRLFSYDHQVTAKGLSRRINADTIIGGAVGAGDNLPAAHSMCFMEEPQKSGMTTEGSNFNQSYNSGRLGRMEFQKHTLTFGLYGQTESGVDVTQVVTPKTKTVCDTCGTGNPYGSKFCSECGTNLT
jgi:hypothetical protein